MLGFSEKMQKMKHSIPPWGIAAVFGGFLLQFTMGAFYSFGNMMTYMVSYMRQHGSPNLTYTDFVVVQSTWGMTQGFVMPFSGFIIQLIGEKAAMTAGAAIFSAGCALTYFTIGQSLWMVAATYGFVSAFGQNIALIPTLTTGMKWFPDNKGTVMGIIVGGFGGGAMVFNQIQTAILNPDNVPIEHEDGHQGSEGYFVDEDVLNRVPPLLLILAAIYLVLGMIGALLVTQPPQEFLIQHALQTKLATQSKSKGDLDLSNIDNGIEQQSPCSDENKAMALDDAEIKKTLGVSWKEALRRKEFYILWFTRLSVVLITQVVAALYKAFGTTFINDDQFLSMVGAAASVFNCSGRLVYGFIMDKSSYKVGMSIEAIMLTLLVSTFYLTSLVDPTSVADETAAILSENVCRGLEYLQSTSTGLSTHNISNFIWANFTLVEEDLISDGTYNFRLTHSEINVTDINQMCMDHRSLIVPETAMSTKAVYAIWVWSIFLTFPGTYSMQPAVTSQTFGPRHAGTIYAFLFSSDIINNFMVAALSSFLVNNVGYLGLFLTISVWGIFALVATQFYPKHPSPYRKKGGKRDEKEYKRAPGIEAEMS